MVSAEVVNTGSVLVLNHVRINVIAEFKVGHLIVDEMLSNILRMCVMCACACASVYVLCVCNVCLCVCTCVHVCVYVRTCTCVHVRVCLCVCT